MCMWGLHVGLEPKIIIMCLVNIVLPVWFQRFAFFGGCAPLVFMHGTAGFL